MRSSCSCFGLGAGSGEATALRPEDLDLRSRYVRVERSFSSSKNWETSPKNGRKRQVDLAADLVPMLKAHLAMSDGGRGLAGTAGAPWAVRYAGPGRSFARTTFGIGSGGTVEEARAPVSVRARTRHTFASRLNREGANLVNVQRQFGHSSISVQ